MSLIITDFGITRESARRLRVEPTGGITQTNVQKALEQLDTGKTSKVGTARYPAAAATVALTTADIEVGIDTTAQAVTVDLPSALAWAAANPNGLELTIFDVNGHADTHNITPSLNGADTFAYGSVTPTVTLPFGKLALRPNGSPVSGWYVRGLN